MYLIWGVIVASTCFALLITPKIQKIATKYNLVDHPSHRKLHSHAIPRIGGVAIFLAFILPFSAALFLYTHDFDILFNTQLISFLAGAILIFGLGLYDDISPLSPKTKFIAQIIIALVAFIGGIRITEVSISLSTGIDLRGATSLFATVFWFVLVINAINLLDGLDGLSAGVSFFAALMLTWISFRSGNIILSIGFAAITGSTLGFLRYNFNPAIIFMGDCGSYFLGYTLAALSAIGAMKSQTTVALLIPIIALGVPLIDTVFAPIRRFILGQNLFKPDMEHLHHKLLKIGYSHRRSVIVIYAITIFMGLISLALVNAKDQSAALILLIPGLLAIIGIQKLGYLEYLAMDKVVGWFRDMTDTAGLTSERRSFLHHQLQIFYSLDINNLWENMCIALEKLHFDMAEIHIKQTSSSLPSGSQTKMAWEREGFNGNITKDCLFKVEMPLLDAKGKNYGSLWLVKDLERTALSHYTLRRVEHLRRSLIKTLEKLL